MRTRPDWPFRLAKVDEVIIFTYIDFVKWENILKKTVKRIKGLVHRQRRKGLQPMSSFGWLDNDRLVESDPLRSMVLKRLAPAVRDLVRASPKDQLLEALGANTSIDALIHLVSSEGVAAEVASNVQDPLREAKARAAKKVSGLLSAEGGPIGVEDVSKVLRISRAAVDKRRKTGTLIGIEDGGRAILYPSWQFTHTGLLPGLDESLKAMVIVDPWMRIQFFLSHDVDLGTRPLDALRSGRVDEVILAARRYGRLGEDG